MNKVLYYLGSPTAWKCFARISRPAVLAAAALLPVAVSAQTVQQQGPALIASGSQPAAISADGITALFGDPGDGSSAGAAWVYVRQTGGWLQANKLVATDAVGAAQQGVSVSLSADGNTALVGAPADNGGSGAAWVFVRAAGAWTQQAKLVGTGASGGRQGISVALSGDGSAAIIGAPGDGNGTGAAWVFTHDSSGWKQQAKLVGTGTLGVAGQGAGVALSFNGTTALVGGASDNSGAGATWVFVRGDTGWSQQAKLVGTGTVGQAKQGASVTLAADGNTAVIGGYHNDAVTGAAWVFTRVGTAWSQRGNKLIGAGASGTPANAYVTAISEDGSLVVLNEGAAGSSSATWVYARNMGVFVATPHKSQTATADVDGDGMNDIVWRDSVGTTAIWQMSGDRVAGSGGVGVVADWSLVAQRDFNGDGKADWLWRNTAGDTVLWFFDGGQVKSTAYVGNVAGWSVIGTGDFDGDGKADILWRHTSGSTAMWLMSGAQVKGSGGFGSVPQVWSVQAVADFNGDGKADILWRNTAGDTVIWFFNGLTVASTASLGNTAGWSVLGTGDLDGDGKWDLMWINSSGVIAAWLLDGAKVTAAGGVSAVASGWSAPSIGDFDGDGKSDILWRHTSGSTVLWFMNGQQISAQVSIGFVPASWTVQTPSQSEEDAAKLRTSGATG